MTVRHSLHAEPVLDKRDVIEIQWILSSPGGVMAEERGRGREEMKKHDTHNVSHTQHVKHGIFREFMGSG